MYRFLLPWLAFEMTGSALAIGWVALASALPGLVALPYGSVTADRIDRARLLRITQSTAALTALSLAGLLVLGVFEIAHLVVVAALMSVIQAFDQPARMSIIPALVRGSALVSAFALAAAAWNVSQIAAPMAAGALIAAAQATGGGPGPIFVIVSAGYALTALTMSRIRLSSERAGLPAGGWSGQFVEGLRFVLGRSDVRSLFLVVSTTGTFGMSYVYLMPVFAKEVYGTDARGLGVLVSSVGIGALLGTVLLARFGGERKRGLLFVAAALGFAATLTAFAASRSFEASMALLVVVGALAAIYLTLGQTLVAMLAPDAIRGRVMGLFGLTWIIQGAGGALSASLAAVVGPQFAVAAVALVVIAVVGSVALLSPGLRSID